MPSKEKERIYWDSCVFIDLLQRSEAEGRIEILDEYIKQAEQGDLEIVTSDLTLCEVATLKELGLPDEEVERKIVDFFENPYILLRSLDRRVAVKTREIMRTVNLQGADATHIATATLTNVSAFHTYDDKVLRKASSLQMSGKVLDKDGNPLKIEKPPYLGPPVLAAIRDTNGTE